ncbi:GNAT family N-acetyltransferase [Antrihabitans sp. NCIMB 15449]|uniref:GNAT family N-acetyltransferase n=1 Tax=Antrihabitans spumae TaxID=3373370 RepID=A0ABW7JVJ8_9NOCA
MTETVVRSFRHDDRVPLRQLFDRAGADSPVDQLWGHRDSEAAVYLDPYMDTEPESLLVAHGDGRLVGYLTGCVDSSRFPTESERIDRAIKEHRLMRRPSVLRFFLRSLRDLALARLRHEESMGDGFTDPRWPAHLHIAVLAEFRGTGVAEQLMTHWLTRLDEARVPGCHLQTTVDNPRAIRFFERMGFTRHGATPAIPGVRYNGHRQHLQTMVLSLPGT